MLHLSTIVLIILPYCCCFSPSTLTDRISQVAATKTKQGVKPNEASKKPEVSDRIRDAALSIIALSAPVLLKEPLGETTTEIQDDSDDFESLFDEQVVVEKSNQKKNPIQNQATSTIKSNGKTYTDPNNTTRKRIIKTPVTSQAEHPKTEIESKSPSSTEAGNEGRSQPSWGDLLVKEESMAKSTSTTFELVGAMTESVPSKEELRRKVLQPRAQQGEPVVRTTEKESLAESSLISMETPTEADKSKSTSASESTSTLQPHLVPNVSTSFGKQLTVIKEGLPPLRQWPKRESELPATASSNSQ